MTRLLYGYTSKRGMQMFDRDYDSDTFRDIETDADDIDAELDDDFAREWSDDDEEDSEDLDAGEWEGDKLTRAYEEGFARHPDE
jgi:hypothetical protein